METIHEGYGNSGDLVNERGRALQAKKFPYLVIKTSGVQEGMIGGSFGFTIFGAKSYEEIPLATALKRDCEVVNVTTMQAVSKKRLAEDYLKNLSDEARDQLLSEIIIEHLSK